MAGCLSKKYTKPSATSPVNAVYFPNWRIHADQLPSSFDLSTITHVFYAFASLEMDGMVRLSDEDADCHRSMDGTNGALHAWAQVRKHYPDLKLVLSVGGLRATGATFAEVSSCPIKARVVAESARALIDKFEFDGIDGR